MHFRSGLLVLLSALLGAVPPSPAPVTGEGREPFYHGGSGPPPAASGLPALPLQTPDTALVDPLQEDTLLPPGEDILPPIPAMQPDDEALDLLARIYARIPGLQGVEARLDRGILELSGRALSFEDRELALTTARDLFPGVAFVDARGLSVETDVRRRVEPAVERLREKGVAFLRFLPSLLTGLLVLGGGIALAVRVGRQGRLFDRVTRNPFVRSLLQQVVRAAIVLVALLLALDLMAITTLVGALLGAAGVMGIAVGFAFRDIVENYLAGVLLSLRRPFGPNDHIQLAGEEGRVIRLTGRETILMTLDGNHVRIPNATVFKAVITNLTRNPRRRFLFSVGIAPWEEVGRALTVAREAVGALPGVLEHPRVTVNVHQLQDSGIELRVAGWVDQTQADFGKVRSQALRAVKEAYEAAGVATPPPEYGIRILEGGGNRLEAATGATADEGLARGRAPAPASTDPDITPDRTIEEEIARELRVSAEENLLEPPPPGREG